jgi:hypothetical protein
LEWLYYHGILARKDHHYRVYDLTSHEDFVVDLGYARKQLHTKVQMMATKPEVPEGPDHRAMHDCLKQCRQYNGLLMLVKRL